jgi:type IV secretion system protein VirB5
MLGILSLLIALTSISGIIYIGSQSKFVPYIVEVDKLGQPLAIAPAQRSAPIDPRIMSASLSSFVSDARLVTPDVALQRKAIFRVYALLSPNDPGTLKMNEWFKGAENSSPFKRAEKEQVSVDIASIIQQTPETWQVDWVETTRDRQGVIAGQPAHMRALVTAYVVNLSPNTSEEHLRQNPLGIYVRDFSWTKQL